jgi:hypothetical protein
MSKIRIKFKAQDAQDVNDAFLSSLDNRNGWTKTRFLVPSKTMGNINTHLIEDKAPSLKWFNREYNKLPVDMGTYDGVVFKDEDTYQGYYFDETYGGWVQVNLEDTKAQDMHDFQYDYDDPKTMYGYDSDSDDEYHITVDFTTGFYDMMDASETGEDEYDMIQRAIYSIEEHLEDNAILLSFEYVGQKQYDIISNYTTYEKCVKAKELLEQFLGDWSDIDIISHASLN